MSTLLRLVLSIGALMAAGCGTDPVVEGAQCKTSAQCAAGLLCDTAQRPAVCVTMGGPHPDLATSGPTADLAGMAVGGDMAGADLSAAMTDLSMVALPDLAQRD